MQPKNAIFRFVVFAALAASPVLCGDWNKRLAADYLDSRQKEWFAWKPAAAPGGTCLSCHTGLTYLLTRPPLRKALGESERTSYETGLLAALRARVGKTEAKDISNSFTKHPLAEQAVGVETVVAALFFATEDRSSAALSDDAAQAFDRLWRLQLTEGPGRGAWEWFSLDLDPWEMPESRFFGATLAALAAGSAPAGYRGRADVREHVAALIAYLKREQESQSLHNRLMLLWASTKLNDVLPVAARRMIIEEVWRKQQADGGWTMDSLGPWKDHAAAPVSTGSNSYATGLAAFILQKAGTNRSDPRMGKALDWLSAHQDPEKGNWSASSMNKKFEAGSMQVQFMNDAASSFAVLALLDGSEKHANK